MLQPKEPKTSFSNPQPCNDERNFSEDDRGDLNLYELFLCDLLEKINNNDIQAVHQLLRDNLDKLNQKLAEAISEWVRKYLSRGEFDQASKIANSIATLADLIKSISTKEDSDQVEILIAGCRSALDIYRYSLPSNQETLDQSYLQTIANRGDTYRILGKYDQALSDLSRVIELDSGNAFALAGRGETHRLLGSYELAFSDLNQAIEIEPNYAFALASRGWLYQAASLYEEAVLDLKKAIEIDSKNIFALNTRAEVYRAVGCYEEAISDFDSIIGIYETIQEEKVLKTFPTEWASLQIKLASSLCRRNKSQEDTLLAIQCYENALKVYTYEFHSEDWAETHESLALAYLGLDSFGLEEISEKAVTACQNALKVFSCEESPERWASVHLLLAGAYQERGYGDQNENSKQVVVHCINALKIF